MNKNEDSPLTRWARDLESLGRRLQSSGKALLTANEDPFAQRDLIGRVTKTVADVTLESLKAPPEVKAAIDSACIEATAEFWQQFCSAAKELGWEVLGSTNRRLVSRAFFVELKGDVVTIDALSGRHSPHVASLIETLKPHIDTLTTDQKALQEFVDIVAQAYDTLGGQGDLDVESVFRQAVMLRQPTAFWTLVDPSKFESLPRFAFRYRLSAILEHGTKPTDGRDMRLTPTVNRKDVWEIYSPAEGHVVQIGRIRFYKR